MSAIAMEADNMENLIIKACGGRSLTEFAKSCGISTMHVSRIKSGIAKPSKKMCIKLSSDLYVKQIGITSEDFMRAAGYEDETEIVSTTNFEQILNDSFEFFTIGFIARKLLSKGITFRQNPSLARADVDFTFEILDGRINEWNVCIGIKENISIEKQGRVTQYYLLGRIITFEAEDNVQYTLVLSNAELYQWLCSASESLDVHANVTIVLLDNKQMAVTKEIHLGSSDTYLSLLDEPTIK